LLACEAAASKTLLGFVPRRAAVIASRELNRVDHQFFSPRSTHRSPGCGSPEVFVAVDPPAALAVGSSVS
jgi:hypothetical protein